MKKIKLFIILGTCLLATSCGSYSPLIGLPSGMANNNILKKDTYHLIKLDSFEKKVIENLERVAPNYSKLGFVSKLKDIDGFEEGSLVDSVVRSYLGHTTGDLCEYVDTNVASYRISLDTIITLIEEAETSKFYVDNENRLKMKVTTNGDLINFASLLGSEYEGTINGTIYLDQNNYLTKVESKINFKNENNEKITATVVRTYVYVL